MSYRPPVGSTPEETKKLIKKDFHRVKTHLFECTDIDGFYIWYSKLKLIASQYDDKESLLYGYLCEQYDMLNEEMLRIVNRHFILISNKTFQRLM